MKTILGIVCALSLSACAVGSKASDEDVQIAIDDWNKQFPKEQDLGTTFIQQYYPCKDGWELESTDKNLSDAVDIAFDKWNILLGLPGFLHRIEKSSMKGCRIVALPLEGRNIGYTGSQIDRTTAITIDMAKIKVELPKLNYPYEMTQFLTIIVAHELGHSMGLGHVFHGIMSAPVEPIFDFTPFDIDECQRVKVCK